MKRREFLRSAGSAAALSLPIAQRVFAAPCSPPTVNVAGGTTANTSCQAPPTPPTALPAYMQNMTDFQVKNLQTVSGGNVTMFSTLPGEWQVNGQPNGADMVFSAWSGGAADTVGLRMFVHGGGHFDSSNNGIYVYDFSGDTQPVGWSIAPNSLSALGAVTQSTPTYSDGKPAAVHSYNGMWYDRNLNRLYRFGGSNFGPSGAGTSACFYYNFGTSSWVSFLTHSNVGTTLGSTLVGSPDGSKVLYLASTKSPIFVNTSSAAATVSGSALSGSEESGFATAMDTSRSNTGTGVCRYVSFCHDNSGTNCKVITVNWPSNSWTVTTQALTGTYASELNASGPCVLYDAQRDSFWVLANSSETSDGLISYIYEVNASTFAVSRYSLSTPIQTLTANKGGFNRHIWFPNWRIIGTVHAHNQPMSLIKVP
jgi:hypothetical protein